MALVLVLVVLVFGLEKTVNPLPFTIFDQCKKTMTFNPFSDPLRLVGGASRCAGTVEVKHSGGWRQLGPFFLWNLKADAVCGDLGCGSAVSVNYKKVLLNYSVWRRTTDCKRKACSYCRRYYVKELEVVCSDLLNRPIISLSVIDGVSEARPQGVRVLLGSKFRVKCSVEPQFPGGSFQLLSPTVDLAQNHTLPAVSHSAHFLFSDTGPAHKGNYTCVYHLQVFNHNFSSQSLPLQLSLGARDSDLIIRVLVVLLFEIVVGLLFYFYCKIKARRGARETTEVELELNQ